MKLNKRQFDGIIAGNVWRQVVTLLLIMVVVWFLLFVVVLIIDSCSGNSLLLFGNESNGFSKGWAVLFQMLDPGNAYMVTAQSTWVARIIGFLLALVGGIVFSGLVISSMSNMFERRMDKIKNGMVKYKLDNHVVIIGIILPIFRTGC